MARLKLTIDQVKQLQSELDAKALASHTHVIGDVTGLQTALDSKADDTHTHALDDLSDVVITTPSNGQIVKFDGTNWVNADNVTVASFDDLTDVDLTGLVAGQTIQWNGTAWVPVNQISMYQEQFVATAGQTIFTVAVAFAATNISMITVNGVQQRLGVDYTASGTTLTFLYALTLDDEVIATYFNK